MTYKIIYDVYFLHVLQCTYLNYFHKMLGLFTVVFKWGNIEFIFMMHNKKKSLLFSESGNTKFIFMMHHKKVTRLVLEYNKIRLYYICSFIFLNFYFLITSQYCSSGIFFLTLPFYTLYISLSWKYFLLKKSLSINVFS